MIDFRNIFKTIREDKGVSVVDAIIAVVIASIIITLAVGFFTNQTRLYTVETQMSELRASTIRALEELTEFLKMVGFDPQQSGNFGVIQASPIEITYTTDKDADGIIDADETIRISYVQTDNSIYLYYPSISSEPIRKIAGNVGFFSLVFLDANLDTLGGGPLNNTEIEQVKAVDVHLICLTEKPVYRVPVSGVYPDGTQYNDRYGRFEGTIRLKLRNLAV